jgi:stearoyl-CoA desaturase (delta-9 desaturase)
MGWMLVHEKPKIAIEPYGRDLERDPVVRLQHKYYVPIAIAMSFGLPTLIGYFLGSWLGGLAIAGFLRVVLVHHATFFINSWCHMWGRQTYTDPNTAKDSFLMAVATFGEGYHNFHHIFANDYRNGVRWYHWDPTKWLISFFAWIGGAYKLRRTPWSEIIKLQMQMDEKRLKERLQSHWQVQFQTKLDTMRAQVESAHTRFEQLREEYRRLANDYSQSKWERVEEIRAQLKAARSEMRRALAEWRSYNSLLLEYAYA